MGTILIRLDPAQLPNPDADLRYLVPDALAKASDGLLRDDAYDYEEGTNVMRIFLATEHVEAGVAIVIRFLEDERVLGNHLAPAAEVAIGSTADGPFLPVYPPAKHHASLSRRSDAMSVDDARTLLVELRAPQRLLRHAELVGEAANLLLARLRDLGVVVNEDLVRLGAALHDVGKIENPREFDHPGSDHEPAGEHLLLAHGVAPEVARMCLTHARWDAMPVSLEELLVALADKLWKGARKPALEQLVIDRVAAALGKARWDLFVELDTLFEEIAADGARRLEQSVRGS